MKQPDPRQESNSMTHKNSQLKIPGIQALLTVQGIERAKAALPIFGGTSPTETSTTTTETKPEDKTTTETSATGGDTAKPLTAEEAAALLTQISETNAKLAEATKTIEKNNQEKTAAERAKLGKEEALTADLEEATKTILKMDAALKNQAVMNAINGVKDLEFHDTNFIMRELQVSAPEIFEDMEVDLDAGVVTVKGVENHLRRIAKEKDWAVKKNSTIDPNANNGGGGGAAPVRSSGAPPANPTVNQDKASRRASLADKYPVIRHGRTKI